MNTRRDIVSGIEQPLLSLVLCLHMYKIVSSIITVIRICDKTHRLLGTVGGHRFEPVTPVEMSSQRVIEFLNQSDNCLCNGRIHQSVGDVDLG